MSATFTRQIKSISPHTAWLEWEPVKRDCRNRPLAPGSVEYLLYLKGGFTPLYRGLEVLVEIVTNKETYERPRISEGSE